MKKMITGLALISVALAYCSSTETRDLKDKNGKVYAKKHFIKGENDREIPQKVEYDKERDGTYERTLMFDEKGMLTEVALDKDTDGKKEQSVYYQSSEKDRSKTKVEKFRNDGSLSKRVEYYPDGKKVKTITFHNKEGNVTRTIQYAEDGSLTSIQPRKEKKGKKDEKKKE